MLHKQTFISAAILTFFAYKVFKVINFDDKNRDGPYSKINQSELCSNFGPDGEVQILDKKVKIVTDSTNLSDAESLSIYIVILTAPKNKACGPCSA